MADYQNSINIACAFAKKWEGLASKSTDSLKYFSNTSSLDPSTVIYPYKDTSNGYSIGWGSFTANNSDGSNDLVGTTITKSQADAIMLAEMTVKESDIRSQITANLNDYQYAAILDYVYNAGEGALQYNGLINTINSGGDVPTALKSCAITINNGSSVSSGLVNRRIDEGLLWNGSEDSLYSMYLRNADTINNTGLALIGVGAFIFIYVKYFKNK